MLTRTGKIIRTAFYLACAFMLTTTTSFAAYIDPATSSYIIQIAAGVVIAGGTAFGIIWNKMRRKLKKKPAETQAPVMNINTDGAQGAVIKADDLLNDDKEG